MDREYAVILEDEQGMQTIWRVSEGYYNMIFGLMDALSSESLGLEIMPE